MEHKGIRMSKEEQGVEQERRRSRYGQRGAESTRDNQRGAERSRKKQIEGDKKYG